MEVQDGAVFRRLQPQASSSTLGAPAWLAHARPLSDIREITEPSLVGSIHRKPVPHPPIPPQLRPGDAANDSLRPAHLRVTSKPDSARTELRTPQEIFQRGGSRKRRPTPHNQDSRSRQFGSPGRPSASRDSKAGSPHSIASDRVPPRSSSTQRHAPSTSLGRVPAVLFPPASSQYTSVTNRAHGQSPVKDVASRLDPAISSHRKGQRVPSKTIIKIGSSAAEDLLEHPTHQHPRLKLDVQLAAPLFVGGGSVEGFIRITVDEADRVRHRKALTLERLSIDLLGVEEVSGPRRNIFLALGNELVDTGHPPPEDMVQSRIAVMAPRERSWILVPSMSNLPFLLTLPLDVGPPPFTSRHARIRYVLVATMTIKDAGRQLCVRSSAITAVLSVYDPEKALVSLPSPLTASDEYALQRGNGHEKITVTAGLHRQVWVSGTNIFADVHIINNSRRVVKRLELQLERIVLCYRHAAAATLEMSASQARLFDQLERTIVCKHVMKAGDQGWNGVLPHSVDIRTCDLELPRGHATVKCNKYFEVRYYLNVVASSNHMRLATVQLPIILIHMNSLDVPTNSVAQVAVAIEEKRAGRRRNEEQNETPRRRDESRSIQGRAFAAPRLQSLERQRAHQDDLHQLGRQLDASPRKHAQRRDMDAASFSFKTPPSNRYGRVIGDADADEIRRRLQPMRSFGSVITNGSAMKPQPEPLRATSALGSYALPSENTKPPSRLNSMLSTRSKLASKGSLGSLGHELASKLSRDRFKSTWNWI
ncbi:hypothetical protein FH972_022780 [Carpinus fangiana]|uniref:Arrestin C-terminal-like domain-containing protein n=1 Tax=Carpinus fangiana TaxID=176857 RepID=A0A5N6KTK0_9ROSI|nr:hypothetical protein FH972_022780 [Carpinus fangiana]